MLKPLKRTLVALAIGGVGLTAGTARADINQVYDVSVRGLNVGILTMASNEQGNAYTATGGITSRGLVGALFPFTLSGTASGRVLAPGKLQPVAYKGLQEDGSKRRDITMRYEGGVPSYVEWVPKRKVRKHDVRPKAQGGTLDPLSAAFAILKPLPQEVACDRTIEIYDGAKRSRIRVGAARQANGGVQCDGVYSRVAGFSPKQMAEHVDFPFTVQYDIRDGKLVIRSVELDSVIGRASLRRR
jgi:uncharacterized protein DUF3108